jgi:hypothetical protein
MENQNKPDKIFPDNIHNKTHELPTCHNQSYTRTSTERSQISRSLPIPKANLAETHQDKAPTPKLKSTTNVLAPKTKIQTFTGKQDSSIQMYHITDLDVWNSALGMY